MSLDIDESESEAESSQHKSRSRQTASFEKVETPEKYNSRIYREFALGNTEECKHLISELLSRSSESICEYALLVRALIARQEGQIKESLDWLQRVEVGNPTSQRLIYELGRTHLLLGEHEKAIVTFDKGIALNSNDWRFYYWKATALYHSLLTEKDAVDQAQECLLQCPKLNKSADMLMFVAKTCVQRNDLIPAIEAYKIAQELEPENLEIISHLGLLYLNTFSEEKAFSCLGRALTYDPNHMPSILAASSILQSNGDYDVALTKYRVAASECDHNGALWNNIGMCFLGKGKLVAAISCLKRANYLNPLDWKILYNLSSVYYSMMQYASAYHFMSAALNLQPNNKFLLMGLAIVLTALNDHGNARKAYAKAVALDRSDIVVRLNFALFEYRHGTSKASALLLQDLPPPKADLDQNQAAELTTIVQRLRECLRQDPEAAQMGV